MYTRSYYPEEEKITVPENYDGFAFSEEKEIGEEKTIQQPDEQPPLRAPWDIPNDRREEKAEEVMASPRGYEGVFGGLMNKLPFGKLFSKGDFFKNTFSDFGTEELLIIGIALFLLFSKDGDKECALILLFLLFVK